MRLPYLNMISRQDSTDTMQAVRATPTLAAWDAALPSPAPNSLATLRCRTMCDESSTMAGIALSQQLDGHCASSA